MSSEVFWLYLLKPSCVHQAAASDVSFTGVNHLCEHNDLEKTGSRLNVFNPAVIDELTSGFFWKRTDWG